jgi:hypothetical protein
MKMGRAPIVLIGILLDNLYRESGCVRQCGEGQGGNRNGFHLRYGSHVSSPSEIDAESRLEGATLDNGKLVEWQASHAKTLPEITVDRLGGEFRSPGAAAHRVNLRQRFGSGWASCQS